MKINVFKWMCLLATGLVLLALTLAAAGGLGHRFRFIDFRQALTLYRWGVTFSLPALILSFALLGTGIFLKRDPRLIVRMLVATLCSAALFGAGWVFRSKAASLPYIHDISTDTENPPAFKAIIALRAGAPNPAEYAGEEVAQQQKQAYPEIAPIEMTMERAQAFEHALSAARRMGWQIIDSDADEGRIEAVDTTLFFGFKDDVVIRVSAIGENRSRIDVRSVSRVGKSDVGANAARIRDYSELVRRLD